MAQPTTIPAAIDAFLVDVAQAGSARSAQTYRSALARFLDYLDAKIRRERKLSPRQAESQLLLPPLTDLTIQEAVDFIRWLDDYMKRERRHAASQSTLFTYSAAIQSFYAFLHREQVCVSLDLETLRQRLKKLRGRRERSLPRVPDDQVIDDLCRVARAVPVSSQRSAELIRQRDIALLECLRSSGMRVSEAVSLRREDISLNDQSATVRGKGGKERVVFFSNVAIDAIEQYWMTRADEKVTRHIGSLPAFARHNDGATGKVLALSTQGVRYIVDRLRRRAGETWPVTPHRLRAWFATHLLDHDVDLASVQELLGHESANTTRIYTKVRSRRLQDAHRRAFESE